MVDAGERADVVLESVLDALRLPRRARGLRRPAGRDPGREPRRARRRGPRVRRRPGRRPVRRPGRRRRRHRRPGLADFLERVALVADTDQIPDAPDGEDGGVVTLMTLHTAKGLEFPVVFLTGLEDGVFPHTRSLGDQPELEEERRLAYVGVTRAQQRLYVSRAVMRSAWGAPSHNPASRFLDEMPVDLVDWRRTEAAQTRWGRPDLTGSAGGPGQPHRRRPPQLLLRRAARRRRRQGQAGPRDPVARPGRPGPARLVRAWAPWSRSRARATSRSPRSTSAPRASSGCCCATRRSRSSDRRLCLSRPRVRPGPLRDAAGSGRDAVLDERGVRVDRVAAAGADLEVQVRAGDVAGRADVADQLAGATPCRRADRERTSGGSTRARCRPRG